MAENESCLSIEGLERIILDRKQKMPAGSYVGSLLSEETDRSAQKVVEEAGEFAIASTRMGITGQGEPQVVSEAADVAFHLLVTLVKLNIPWIRIREELTKRHAEKT